MGSRTLMPVVKTLLLLALISVEAPANDRDAVPGVRGRPAGTELPVAVARIPLLKSVAMPVVRGTIDGKGPFKFLLDTGGTQMIIDDGVLQAVKIQPTGTATVRDTTLFTSGTVNVVPIDTLVLGEVRFTGLDALVIDFAREVKALRSLDGLLGLSTFADCLFTIDYPTRSVTLERGGLAAADGREILEYKERAGTAVLPLSLGSTTVDLMIDSSLTGAFILANSLKDRIELTPQIQPPLQRGRLISDIDVYKRKLATPVRLGRYELVEAPVAFQPGVSAIGHQILERFAVTFDQQHHRVRLAHPDTAPIRLSPRSRFGLVLARRSGMFRVMKIFPETPAANSAIHTGDDIVSIEGRRPFQFTDDELTTLLRESDSLVIKLERSGAQLLVLLRSR